MSGAVPMSVMRGARHRRDGIPVPLALSAWAAACVAVGLALFLLGVERDVRADAPSAPPSAPGTVAASTAVAGRLPDGREEAGSFAVTAERVRASLPIRHEASLYGWGTLRLDAEPLEDEITVRTIVDAPTASRRWSTACDVVLHVDGTEVRSRAQPVGSRLKSGAYYDAIRFELGIDTVRRLARAEHVEGTLCGAPLDLSPAQRATLEGFVEGFDDIALPVLPSIETEIERMPVDPDEVLDDPDTYLEPA
jgi:hypothetical protein